MDLKDYIKLPYARVLTPEDDGTYSCSVLEFPGCFSCGDTLEEAWSMINEAMECWIEASLDLGQEIPTPHALSDSIFISVELSREEYSQLIKDSMRQKISTKQVVYNAICSELNSN